MNKLIEKLNQLANEKKVSRNSLSYKSAYEAIQNPNTKVRTGKSFGSGRYSSSSMWTDAVISIFNRIGAKYETGNDAPKGGRSGEFVIVKG